MHERWLRVGSVAAIAALGLFLATNVIVLASSVNIYDQAGVLNQGQVQREGSRLAYPLNVYTADYAGSNSAFDQTTRNKVTNNRMIVLAINTRGHVYTDGGSSVPLNSTQYTQASQAFANDYRSNRNFTSATVASVSTLNSLLGATSSRGSNSNSGGLVAARGVSGFGSSALCCIGLLVIAGLAVFAIARRRSFPGGGGMRGMFGNRASNRQDDPYGAGYNQQQGNYPPGNYPQGNNPPGYGPGYPPQQRQGMNPWAAGGLGAAAGGLFGYGLGKEAGERDDQRNYGDQGGGGDFGGDQGGYGGDQGGGADFGGDQGGGADFGGDQGGGADFGGDQGGFGGDQGGGADFGGGGDQGGGSNF